MRDVAHLDGLDRINDDVPVVHRIAAADLHVGPSPDTDAAFDPAAADPFAQAFREDHRAIKPDYRSTFSRISVNRRRIQGLFSWQMYSWISPLGSQTISKPTVQGSVYAPGSSMVAS